MYVPDSASQPIQRCKCLSVSSVCTSQEGSQCGTPRKHNPQEVMRSLEKLQVSREDNPALLRSKRHPGRAESPAPPDDLVLVVPPDGNNVDHSLLIRSPPPQLRQEQTASPTLVMDHPPHTSDPQSLCNMSQTAFFSSTFQIEARREQAERDAAEIISLQKTQPPVSHGNTWFPFTHDTSVSTSDTGLLPRVTALTDTVCTITSRCVNPPYFQNGGLTKCKISQFILLALTLLDIDKNI